MSFPHIADSIYRPLTTNGTATGEYSAVGNYAAIATSFYAEFSKAALITRMIVSVEDVGSLDSGFYGNNIVLNHGVKVYVTDAADNVLLNLTPEGGIRTNAAWGKKCYDANPLTFGLGNEILVVRWTFSKDNGDGLFLGGGCKFKVVLNDSYAGLVDHRFDIRGKLVTGG